MTDFVSKWKLDTDCKDDIVVPSRNVSDAVLSTARDNCRQLFQDKTSSHSVCFNAVSSASYMDLCIDSEVEQLVADRDPHIPPAFHAYLDKCSELGINPFGSSSLF